MHDKLANTRILPMVDKNLHTVLQESVDANFGAAVENIFRTIFEASTEDAINMLKDKVGDNNLATADGANIIGTAAKNGYGEKSGSPLENELDDEINRVNKSIAARADIEPTPLPTENDLDNLPGTNEGPAMDAPAEDEFGIPEMSDEEIEDTSTVFDNLSDDDLDSIFSEDKTNSDK